MNEDGRVIQYGMESGINNSLVKAKCIKSDSANPDVAEIVETACQTPHVIDKKKQMCFRLLRVNTFLMRQLNK